MTSTSKKKRLQTGVPRWKEFMQAAWVRVIDKKRAAKDSTVLVLAWEAETIAAEIVAHGDGAAFLKAVRRGRSTQRQNLRYQLLREVEKLMGDAVPRRRPDANTPDSLALRRPVPLELFADKMTGTIGGGDSTP